MRLRCTNCEASFEGEKDARCPKCLRRTSVVEHVDGGDDDASAAGPSPVAPWPAGTTCSLCLARPVTASTFLVELAAPAKGDPGGAHAWTTLRCRCCDACRRKVERLPRLRLSALPVVALGMAAWVFALLSDRPRRVLGVDKLEAVMLATLLCAFLVGVPLVLVDRASHAARKGFETSWLLRRLQARLGHPDGALPPELWKLLPDADPGAATARGRPVIEAAEWLRS